MPYQYAPFLFADEDPDTLAGRVLRPDAPHVEIVVKPAEEVVSLDEFKEWARQSKLFTNLDALYSKVVTASRVYVERTFGLSFVEQTFRQIHSRTPEPDIILTQRPATEIVSVKYISSWGSSVPETTLASTEYLLSRNNKLSNHSRVWPAHRGVDSFIIEYKAGFGATRDAVLANDAASDYVSALKTIALHIVENPGDSTSVDRFTFEPKQIPQTALTLLQPSKQYVL